MMPSFPLVAGAVSVQLPLQRTWKPAQAVLLTPGGDWHLRALPTGEYVEWNLKFTNLTEAEAQTLQRFHSDMRGSYHSFRFCDPLRNLLAWSEDPTQAPWGKTDALAVTLGSAPIAGARQTSQLLNLSSSEGLIQQTVGCSASFAYSVSVTAKSDSQSTIAILIGGQRHTVTLGGQWHEYTFSAMPGGTSDQVTFAVAIPTGGEVELGGVHAEFGACSPEYRKSEGRQGLFTNARFKDDLLTVSSEERGFISAEATVVARLGE
jgi:hypothetical protein